MIYIYNIYILYIPKFTNKCKLVVRNCLTKQINRWLQGKSRVVRGHSQIVIKLLLVKKTKNN